MIASDCLELDVKNKLKLHLFHMQTCVALCLTMREISDAVAFMCILRFFTADFIAMYTPGFSDMIRRS